MSGKSETEAGFRIIPAGEKPCIWMEAGLVVFKLCDRDYQCSSCPFNRAMQEWFASLHAEHTLFPDATESTQLGYIRDLLRFRIDTSLYYSRFHTWLKPIKRDLVRVGVDDLALTLLGEVEAIRLPQPGTHLFYGEPFGTIISSKRLFNLRSPVTGDVIRVNEGLERFTGLLEHDPLGQGFLFDVKTSHLEECKRYLHTAQEALKWFQEEITWIKGQIQQAFEHTSTLPGAAAMDGGAPAPLIKVVGPEHYKRIINGILGN